VLAVGLAAKSMTEAELDEHESMLVDMERATRLDPARQVTVLTPRFHSGVSSAARRPRLAAMIDSLRDAAMSYQPSS
jgi:DNA-binding GntR family transcriptional regulator